MIAVTSFVRVPQGRAKTARDKMYEILHEEARHFRETTFFTATQWAAKIGCKALSTVYRAIAALKGDETVKTERDETGRRRIHFNLKFPDSKANQEPKGKGPPQRKPPSSQPAPSTAAARDPEHASGPDEALQRDMAREAKLRTAWERLPAAERDAIMVDVKAANPGLERWRNMLEPLCLSVLEARMNETGTDAESYHPRE